MYVFLNKIGGDIDLVFVIIRLEFDNIKIESGYFFFGGILLYNFILLIRTLYGLNL
jgi:hypothetical protein